MINSNFKKYLILFIVALFLVGCSGGEKKPNPAEEKEKTPEVPKVLEEIETMILETMHAIDSMPGLEKAIEEKEKSVKEIEQETEVEQKKEEKDQQAKENIDIEMLIEENAVIIPLLKELEIENKIISTTEPPDNTDKQWYEIGGTVGDIHKSWNVLEPALQEAKVTKTTVEEFEGKLDAVTETIGEKEIEESLMELNQLTSLLADFRGHFKSKTPPEVYKAQYSIREAVLLASEEDFEGAMESNKKAKDFGDILRQRLIEIKGEDVVHKYQLSIEDLEQQLKNENFPLTQMKAAIVIKNTALMMDLFESSVK